MLLFRSEEHIERWCRAWGMERGGTMTPETCWRLAGAWYDSDRRRPEWRRRTAAESQEVFRSLGLTDPFWSLE